MALTIEIARQISKALADTAPFLHILIWIIVFRTATVSLRRGDLRLCVRGPITQTTSLGGLARRHAGIGSFVDSSWIFLVG